MRRSILVLTCMPMLTACLAGNMARDLSYRGRQLAVVEQRYGEPDRKSADGAGYRYVWVATDRKHPCEVTAVADAGDRILDIKMVGKNPDCYRFGR